MNIALRERGREISISFVTHSAMHNLKEIFSFLQRTHLLVPGGLSVPFLYLSIFFQSWSNHNSYTRFQRSRIKEKEESESYSSVKLKIRRKRDERNILHTLFDRLAKNVSLVIFSCVL